MIYHVSIHGCDTAAGTPEAPFRTINRAAAAAAPGDTVQVHSGEYREWVDPQTGGLSDALRVTFEAAPGEHPVIKGSEIVTGWEPVSGTVWKKVLPNAMFGDWNPYARKLEGDWLEGPLDYDAHLGDVYINGRSMYEAPTLEDLYDAPVRITHMQNSGRIDPELVRDPEQTIYRWLAQVDEHKTTLLCNFQDVDPNEALIEINVRKCCFFPTKTGVNYLTVRGFEMAHAACPFAPPTSHQFGMIGPNWSKGWIIEHNHLHDAKCSAVSLGKEGSTGDNWSTIFGRKSGHRYQAEAVFRALRSGWSKEQVGSHLVRNNVIHDCGQNGIVGHMGCAFSRIAHNHIYNISQKREFHGAETAGIKLHAAVDVVIEGNNIHHCNLGTWLDWQAQGARVTRNLYHHNDRDFMIEVTHGPCLFDHNILLSDFAMDNHAQGTAMVHNLIAGTNRTLPIAARATPYHFPHTTAVLGYAQVYGGDDRILNNLFPGVRASAKTPWKIPTTQFSQSHDRFSEPDAYPRLLREAGPAFDFDCYCAIPQPVWIEDNVYAGHAVPYRAETGAVRAETLSASVEEVDGQWFLTLTVDETAAQTVCRPVTTQRLGSPRLTEEPYENSDGSPIDFVPDFFGCRREGPVRPGPFAALTPGTHRFLIWEP